MFNPKLDMRDTEEREPPRELAFKKREDHTIAYSIGIAIALVLIVVVFWSTGAFAQTCVSESRTSVESQHTILFKAKC